ncbi:hypothetical protein A2962_02580 [Candidatus Woesebacteria bacterium RIFCSPLOWO2_01_FULL_39_61]|uniref:Uncharacterized protein n=1 Tax=Candidatus Woesebacteria bacterium RIFCSPHIGHO2_02_FULL_39_13 TaxID=1802505 RepID=A0A1F7Z5F6_9BACT|nr:MAG: hypothetical protein A2692_02900 [Candidatus Woesebacteria bacterium RIFCSPHIGHO2_01_FULL_39_95]OGM34681.1 MAG: hypothetical protein A3D01_04105 [Candidatus Woesebacteria bacterium RIFCSPHIGHO2_02_FULL_39_13]OGM38690.1 MAG: hypothetical protein A3E13_04480 [Candidatus Woesebacteria bacterium RIFCSPHIGHO2_12_FULL_40_20]OGM67224.1 MAG: hypothetical protein A2962_02580 [Candidatus Woesebacteria bacterium RIFCSPLOWO2_01_FULL_39_61]OGM75412.1 MAG: hypothetical protein A3H19_03545 [Candidatus
MNKKVLITIIIIALLLIGGGVYVMSTSNNSKTVPVTTTGTDINNIQEPSQVSQRSLKDLLAAGISQKCTFKDVSNDVEIEGTSYIANGKVRGDFSTTAEGKTSVGHSIFDGKASYVWMDGSSTGLKMEIDTSATSTTEASTQQGLDLNKTIDYNCDAWLQEESVFNPPSDVTFTSFVVPTSSAGDSTQGNQNLCSPCNSLTGEQKTQCLTALKCN